MDLEQVRRTRLYAYRLARTLVLDSAEAESAALEALARAALEWDPEGGQTFNGFVADRIRFAVLDAERRWRGWEGNGRFDRGRRRTCFDVDAGHGDFERSIAAEVDVEDEALADLVRAAQAEALLELAQRLGWRHRAIVARLLAGDTLRQAGATLGVTESRACQLWRAVAAKAKTSRAFTAALG